MNVQVQTAIDPAVVARVRKLMNLSKDGAASENEQEIAASHAQRLMMEHNISVAMVEASHDTSTVVRRKKEGHVGHAMYEWQEDLMARCATTSFVTVTNTVTTAQGTGRAGTAHRVKGYVLVGREENVVSCRIMFDYLRTTTERLAREYAGPGRALSNEAMSFKKGCAARVGSRLLTRHREALAAQRAASECAAKTGNALTIIMEDFAEAEACANEDFKLGLTPGTTAHRKYFYARQGDAYLAVQDALSDVAYADVDDLAMLKQKSDELATATVAAAGLTDEELARVLDYARYAVTNHIQAIKERRNPKKARRSRARSWGRSKSDNTNYDAYTAGSEAGSRVGLDRQADHGAASVKKIG